MDEADQLADNIVVISEGKVIAEGTSDNLKSKIGSDRLELTIAAKSDFAKAKSVIIGQSKQADSEKRVISIASKGGAKAAKDLLQRLEDANIEVETISLHRPTLDDVFLSLTGHVTTSEPSIDKTKKTKVKK